MPKVFCLLFLILPNLLWAASPECFQGEWLLDAKNSDNADRLLKKLERKQKQQEKVLYRQRGSQGDERENLSLMNTLPAFLFLQEDLAIEIFPDEVVLSQAGLVRRINTNGSGQPVSLKLLQQQSETRVAGWDKGNLVIETTAVDGSKVSEVFSVKEPLRMLVAITIQQAFEKEIIMEKIYQRKVPAAGCQVQ